MDLIEESPKLLTSATLFSGFARDLSLPPFFSFVLSGADDFWQWLWQGKVVRPGTDQPVIACFDLVPVCTLLGEDMSR